MSTNEALLFEIRKLTRMIQECPHCAELRTRLVDLHMRTLPAPVMLNTKGEITSVGSEAEQRTRSGLERLNEACDAALKPIREQAEWQAERKRAAASPEEKAQWFMGLSDEQRQACYRGFHERFEVSPEQMKRWLAGSWGPEPVIRDCDLYPEDKKDD